MTAQSPEIVYVLDISTSTSQGSTHKQILKGT